MSEILVDGNNLAHELWDLRAVSDDYDRRLIELLRRHQANLGKAGERVPKITLLFDSGAGEGVPPGGRALKIRVAVPGDKADDLIIQHLNRARRHGGSAAHITVVSNDRQVRDAAQEAGAKHLDCQQFGRLLRRAREIPADEKEEITRAGMGDIEQAFLKQYEER
jgi:hypothetical protein